MKELTIESKTSGRTLIYIKKQETKIFKQVIKKLMIMYIGLQQHVSKKESRKRKNYKGMYIRISKLEFSNRGETTSNII